MNHANLRVILEILGSVSGVAEVVFLRQVIFFSSVVIQEFV
jgi:hypothetical protein